MGGGASGKGGVADATLNVVPFIDLLACTICFLLISAVWSSLARVDVDQALPKASKTPPKEPPKPEPKINIAITPTGYLVNLQDADKMATPKPDLITPFKVPVMAGEDEIKRSAPGDVDKFKKYDRAKLQEKLEEYMKAAGMHDQVKVMVSATDVIPYTHLVAALDTVLASCEEKEGGKQECVNAEGKPARCCLKNPSVGDINLLRAAGFSTFD